MAHVEKEPTRQYMQRHEHPQEAREQIAWAQRSAKRGREWYTARVQEGVIGRHAANLKDTPHMEYDDVIR
eukprot:8301391-Lingulodinium_polyedra.AAC.1